MQITNKRSERKTAKDMGILADHYDVWARWDAERQRTMEKFPKCGYCGEAITDDYFYIIRRTFVCESCLNREHRQATDDYTQE